MKNAGIITLEQLAKASGVSRSTAGLILNGKAEELRITPETAARVRQAAEHLGYIHNSAARQLKDRKTRKIAYILATNEPSREIINPFVFSMMRHLLAHHYQTLVLELMIKSEEINPLFMERRFDGMVLSGAVPNQKFFEKWGKRHGIPYVYIHHDQRMDNCAGIDEEKTASHLVDALYSRGFRKIAYYFPRDIVANPLFPPSHVFSREKFLRRALEAKGLTLYPDTVEQRGNADNPAAYLMTLPNPPDCVIGFNVLFALKFMRGIAPLGLSIPRDVGLVVYGCSEYNAATGVAGVKFDCDRIGQDLAEMILERISTGKNLDNRFTPGELALEWDGVRLETLDRRNGQS